VPDHVTPKPQPRPTPAKPVDGRRQTPEEEAHLKVLRILEVQPAISQRDLAKALGISLGKTNYCLKALLARGWIKARNFKNSENKIAYRYLLTPEGVDNKTRLVFRFLQRKKQEYKALEQEIAQLEQESRLLDKD
jgi:EPS-associated MarR family transcriptional regulator